MPKDQNVRPIPLSPMSEHPQETPDAPARTNAVINWAHVQEYGYPRAERIRLGLEPIGASTVPDRTSALESPGAVTAAQALDQMHTLLAGQRATEGLTHDALYGGSSSQPPHDGTSSPANGWNAEDGVAVGGDAGGFDAGDH